jgi:release factor glutamine methyltransferase
VPTIADLLKASGLPLPDARALLAHSLRCTREALIAHPERRVDDHDANSFEQLAARRRAGEPLAYLQGEREFYGRTFKVGPAVLIPRPETELLVTLALERAQSADRPRLLDLGTGSGCIAITLALEAAGAEVVATDISRGALDVARANAARLEARVTFIESHWYATVDGSFDLIVANPPYVAPGDPHLDALRHEPAQALVAADGGLACLRQIVAGASAHLSPGGWLLVEHGYDQAAAVREMLAKEGFDQLETVPDDARIERVTLARSAQGEA